MDLIRQAKTSGRETRIEKVLKPLHTFVRNEAAGGIVLLLATVVALAWVNSPWSTSYHRL